MLVEPWLLPVLWHERDWCVAIARLATEMAETSGKSTAARRSARELGKATEYIDPDRRHAIRVYELAGPGGDLGRARELAIELGWWKTRARLCAVARAAEEDGPLIVDEAEAWWDAGHPDMCALALAGLRGDDRTPRAYELLALVAGRDLDTKGDELAARAASGTGLAAADDYVMAARFATAATKHADAQRWLEAALAASPGHRIAATKLLSAAIPERTSEAVARFLRTVHQGLDPASWVDTTRASALALIETKHHRGYGQRMLRQALERAYDAKLAVIPGHLAMWRALVDRATVAGTRRDLLPLAIRGIECSAHEVDHVYLGALATEISLREGGSAVVAGAYAEIVAEHAPEHPILRDLVTSVASTTPDKRRNNESSALAIPSEAVDAATDASQRFEVHLDLAEVYAVASRAATVEPADVLEEVPAPAKPEPPAPAKPLSRPTPVPGTKPAAVATRAPVAKPPEPKPATPEPKRASAEIKAAAAPKPTPAAPPVPAPPAPPAPAPPAPVAPPIKPASLVPGVLTNRAAARHAISPPVAKPVSTSSPVLAALRTPDRPLIPPKPAEPPNASPRARRIPLTIDVILRISNDRMIAAQSRDISTSGLFVVTDAELEVGATVDAELMVPGAEPFSEEEFTSKARIVRSAAGGYGVELVDADTPLLRALAALYERADAGPS